MIYNIQRKLKIIWRWIQAPLFFLDFFVAKLKYKKPISQCYDISPAIKKNLCVFSHFDRDNKIDSYVIYYLQELARFECDIIFVTTSQTLELSEREKIIPYCHKIIIKENQGRDFSAFRHGLEQADDLSRYEKIILTNDSIYGPFFDLNKIINYGIEKNLDMWGASDSWEHHYHIQSYFVVFSQALIQNQSFKQFWQHVYPLKWRKSIIFRYELGTSRYFLRKRFKLGAFCNYVEIKNSLRAQKKYHALFQRRPYLNPTHFLWDVLIAHYHFPFIKRELVLRNPRKVELKNWQQFLQQYTSFNTNLISEHLGRITSQ